MEHKKTSFNDKQLFSQISKENQTSQKMLFIEPKKAAWRVLGNKNDDQSKLRISREMKECLKSKADLNGRTLNNEILYRLAQTLYEEGNYLTTTHKGENHENI